MASTYCNKLQHKERNNNTKWEKLIQGVHVHIYPYLVLFSLQLVLVATHFLSIYQRERERIITLGRIKIPWYSYTTLATQNVM